MKGVEDGCRLEGRVYDLLVCVVCLDSLDWLVVRVRVLLRSSVVYFLMRMDSWFGGVRLRR